MVVKIYVSGISGNKDVKKKQQRVQMILDSKSISYEAIDITEPGKEKDKEMMQQKSKIREALGKHPLPPQIFNEEEYCGDYDDFDLANEVDQLEAFLHLPIPSKLSIDDPASVDKLNGSREDSSGIQNGGNRTEINGDVELNPLGNDNDAPASSPKAGEEEHNEAGAVAEVVNNAPELPEVSETSDQVPNEPETEEMARTQEADEEIADDVAEILTEENEISVAELTIEKVAAEACSVVDDAKIGERFMVPDVVNIDLNQNIVGAEQISEVANVVENQKSLCEEFIVETNINDPRQSTIDECDPALDNLIETFVPTPEEHTIVSANLIAPNEIELKSATTAITENDSLKSALELKEIEDLTQILQIDVQPVEDQLKKEDQSSNITEVLIGLEADIESNVIFDSSRISVQSEDNFAEPCKPQQVVVQSTTGVAESSISTADVHSVVKQESEGVYPQEVPIETLGLSKENEKLLKNEVDNLDSKVREQVLNTIEQISKDATDFIGCGLSGEIELASTDKLTNLEAKIESVAEKISDTDKNIIVESVKSELLDEELDEIRPLVRRDTLKQIKRPSFCLVKSSALQEVVTTEKSEMPSRIGGLAITDPAPEVSPDTNDVIEPANPGEGVPTKDIMFDMYTPFNIDRISYTPQLVAHYQNPPNAPRSEGRGVPIRNWDRRPSEVDVVKEVRSMLDERDTDLAICRARARAGLHQLKNPHRHFIEQMNKLVCDIESAEEVVDYQVVHPPPPPKQPTPPPPVNEFLQEVLRALNAPWPPKKSENTFLKQVKDLVNEEQLVGDGNAVYFMKEKGPERESEFAEKVRTILDERESTLGIVPEPKGADHSEFLGDVLILLNDEPIVKDQESANQDTVQSDLPIPIKTKLEKKSVPLPKAEKLPTEKEIEVAQIFIRDNIFPVHAKVSTDEYKIFVSSLGSTVELTTGDLEAVTITVAEDNGYKSDVVKIVVSPTKC